MTKNNHVFRQRDLPLLVRWWRGYLLFIVLSGTYQLLVWGATWSPIDLDSLPDGVTKSILFVGSLAILLPVLIIVAPLILHYIAFDIIAKPAIKSALANTTPKPSVLEQLPGISPEEEPVED